MKNKQFSEEEIASLLEKGVNKRLAMSVLVEKNGERVVSIEAVPNKDDVGAKGKAE